MLVPSQVTLHHGCQRGVVRGKKTHGKIQVYSETSHEDSSAASSGTTAFSLQPDLSSQMRTQPAHHRKLRKIPALDTLRTLRMVEFVHPPLGTERKQPSSRTRPSQCDHGTRQQTDCVAQPIRTHEQTPRWIAHSRRKVVGSNGDRLWVMHDEKHSVGLLVAQRVIMTRRNEAQRSDGRARHDLRR